MIYPHDEIVPLPVRDLYDALIMLMSIAAAKDMYEKGLKLLEDFYTKYGDFMSPIAKDMDWYNQNVTGKVRDTINNLYANGIDPLRSAEGRAAIALLIYSMPTGDIAKVKQSAEDAKQYLKAKAVLQSKGLWNPEYENMILGGKSLENWGTVEDGIWNRTSPAEYMDLNQYTSHIFDNVKDSYIGTDKNHYDWYGVTENDLHKSLTPDTLGGLLNSDLGKFHYNNAKNDLLRQGITNPTDAQIMQQFRNNIVAANHERVHQDRKINEMWKMQQEHRSRMSAARASKETTLKEVPVGWTDRLKFNVMVSNIMKNKAGAAKSFNDYIKNKKNLNSKGSISVKEDTRKLISDYYNATMSDIEQFDIPTANAEFEKGSRQDTVNTGTGSTRKRTLLSFANLLIRPTAYAEVQWAGQLLTKGSFTRSFAEYLLKNKIEGESIGTPTINHKPGSLGDLYELNKTLRVSLKDLQGWIDEHPDTWKQCFESMGISKVTMMEKQYKVNQLLKDAKFGETDYIDIPTSRRINEQGTGNAAIDTGDDKRQLGASEASKRQQYYINRDMRRYGKE